MKLREQHIYQNAGIPPFFIDYDWSDFLKDNKKMTHYVKLAKDCVAALNKGGKFKLIYIQGEAQSGKQAFTCLLLKAFIRNGFSAKFVSLDELIQMEFDKEAKDNLYDIYNKCDVVCLRIGTVKEHSYTRYVLEKFINTRKNNNKQSIITSRLDMEKNHGLYGKEVCSVLCDGRRSYRIEMRGAGASNE